jgi:hypothetical protein
VEVAAIAASSPAIAVLVACTAASRLRFRPPFVSGVVVAEGLAVGEFTTSGPPGVKVRLPVGVGVLVAVASGVGVRVGVLVAGPGVLVRVGVLVGPEGVVAVGVRVRVGVGVWVAVGGGVLVGAVVFVGGGVFTVKLPLFHVGVNGVAKGFETTTVLRTIG